jgi:hypothetical protein
MSTMQKCTTSALNLDGKPIPKSLLRGVVGHSSMTCLLLHADTQWYRVQRPQHALLFKEEPRGIDSYVLDKAHEPRSDIVSGVRHVPRLLVQFVRKALGTVVGARITCLVRKVFP